MYVNPQVQLSLTDDNPPRFRPGDIGSVSVTGLPDMRVGLLAVDKAVYLLKQETLTRRSVRNFVIQYNALHLKVSAAKIKSRWPSSFSLCQNE